MRNPSKLVGTSIACLLPGSLTAQATWVVPNQSDLAPYIAQASPGDTLLLGSLHPGFTLNKGLTIRPQVGRTVITSLFAPMDLSSGIQVPSGERALLADLDFRPTASTPWWNGGHPVTVAGVASFEGCTFESDSTYALATNGTVTLRNCVARGLVNASGLRVLGGSCSAVDCDFLGSNAFTYPGTNDIYPAPGVRVNSGTLVASQCEFTPGVSVTNPSGGYPVGPSPGLFVQGGSVLASDCTIRGGHFPAGTSTGQPWDGAPAIRVLSGAAQHARCTLLPGNDGSGMPSLPTVGNVTVDADLVGIRSSGALLLGTTWTATATAGNLGQPFGFGFWFALAPSTVPQIPEPIWIDATQAILVLLPAPTPGAAVPASLAIPNLPSLVGGELWCQAFQLDGSLARASAVVGGVIR